MAFLWNFLQTMCEGDWDAEVNYGILLHMAQAVIGYELGDEIGLVAALLYADGTMKLADFGTPYVRVRVGILISATIAIDGTS